jgi:hypothetical protein
MSTEKTKLWSDSTQKQIDKTLKMGEDLLNHRIDPTNGGEDVATAQQMALANPTTENLISIGIIDPLCPENRAKIDEWLKDDPDGSKARAVGRVRDSIRIIVEIKCYDELGIPRGMGSSFHSEALDFENFPDKGIGINTILTVEQIRRLPSYADEYLRRYYTVLIELISGWVPAEKDQCSTP